MMQYIDGIITLFLFVISSVFIFIAVYTTNMLIKNGEYEEGNPISNIIFKRLRKYPDTTKIIFLYLFIEAFLLISFLTTFFAVYMISGSFTIYIIVLISITLIEMLDGLHDLFNLFESKREFTKKEYNIKGD